MENKTFFGVEIIAKSPDSKYIRFDSSDNLFRVIFKKRSWYVEVSARAHLKSASTEIELMEDETLLEFVKRFFGKYTFDVFFDTFNEESDYDDGGGLISFASILD